MTKKYKYDVFLSYSQSDAEAVEKIANALGDAGLHVWFDKWNLIPGQSWVEALNEAISNASAIAVCIGPAGLAKFQQEEFHVAMSTQVSERTRMIIPVLLPGAKTDSIPSFLRSLTYADLRNETNNPREISRLVAAIESTHVQGEINQEERIGDDLRTSGDISGSLQHYEKAIRVAKTAYGDNHPKVADLLIKLANAKQDIGDYNAAMALLEESIGLLTEVYGKDSKQIALAFNNLGSILRDLGDLDRAQMYFEKALAIDQEALGPDHPTVANRYNNLGSIMRDRGDLDRAQMYFEKALAIDQKALGPDHPSIAITLNNLAGLYLSKGDQKSALRTFRKAYVLLKNILGDEHPHTIVVRKNLNSLEFSINENST